MSKKKKPVDSVVPLSRAMSIMQELTDIDEAIQISRIMERVWLDRGTVKTRDEKTQKQKEIIAKAEMEIARINKEFLSSEKEVMAQQLKRAGLERRRTMLRNRNDINKLLSLVQRYEALKAEVEEAQNARELS